MSDNIDKGFGSLESGIRGEYDFELVELLEEGWELQKGNKAKIWQAIGLIFLVMLAVFYCLSAILGIDLTSTTGDEDWRISLFFQAAIGVTLMPLTAGLYIMTIKMAAGAPTQSMEVLGYFEHAPKLLAWYFIHMFFTYAGFFALILPGIYLTIAYQLALPIFIEKNLGIWESLEASRKALTPRWFGFAYLILVMTSLSALSLMTIIGAVWTVPWYFCTIGVLYRRIFGLEEVRPQGPAQPQEGSSLNVPVLPDLSRYDRPDNQD